MKEANPYEYDGYDKPVPWIPQQNQFSEGRNVTARTRQQPLVKQNQRPQSSGNQKPKPPERMPKARALALARTLKKGLVIASVAGFGTFSWLVAYHQVGTTATQASSGSSKTTTATPSSTQKSNNFLQQKGGNKFGSNTASPTPVNTPTPTPSPTPVSGSSVSHSH